MSRIKLTPPDNYQHFGCPSCGRLFTLPADPGEAGPWCIHHDSNYSWRPPMRPEAGWTQTLPLVLAEVEPVAETETPTAAATAATSGEAG